MINHGYSQALKVEQLDQTLPSQQRVRLATSIATGCIGLALLAGCSGKQTSAEPAHSRPTAVAAAPVYACTVSAQKGKAANELEVFAAGTAANGASPESVSISWDDNLSGSGDFGQAITHLYKNVPGRYTVRVIGNFTTNTGFAVFASCGNIALQTTPAGITDIASN